jgi:zinc/manganese transport system ATP-binding protein
MTIQLTDLTLSYEKHPAVHHLSATIEHGGLLAIVGPNGAGKSTLLNALAGLTKINHGSISGLCSDEVAYLPQQSQIDRSFPLTVAELVAMGLWPHLGFNKKLQSKHQEQCRDAINSVGLQGFENCMISGLSGGQMQRALFARLLVQNQKIIMLDEPFNAIDEKTVVDLTKIIQSWDQEKRTVIMVSHDFDYVKKHCPKTLLLARECVSHGLTDEVLTDENLKRAKQLCEASDSAIHMGKKQAA